MPQESLNLANLQDLDYGLINKAFESNIAAAANDCYLRPEDKSPRKVQMTFILKPIMSHGALDRIETAVDFATKIPVMKTRVYSMQPKVNRGQVDGLLFHPDLPDDPDGTSVMDVAEQNKKNSK